MDKTASPITQREILRMLRVRVSRLANSDTSRWQHCRKFTARWDQGGRGAGQCEPPLFWSGEFLWRHTAGFRLGLACRTVGAAQGVEKYIGSSLENWWKIRTLQILSYARTWTTKASSWLQKLEG